MEVWINMNSEWVYLCGCVGGMYVCLCSFAWNCACEIDYFNQLTHNYTLNNGAI